jgi:hypothetical protein
MSSNPYESPSADDHKQFGIGWRFALRCLAAGLLFAFAGFLAIAIAAGAASIYERRMNLPSYAILGLVLAIEGSFIGGFLGSILTALGVLSHSRRWLIVGGAMLTISVATFGAITAIRYWLF